MIEDFNQDNSNCHKRKIKTAQYNEINLTIEFKNYKLTITCFYEKNYFRKTFTNSFTLEELKSHSPYYSQFSNVRAVLKEIIENQLKGKEYLEGNEETSDSIDLIIPIHSAQTPKLIFELIEVKKTPEQILSEYRIISKKYEYKFTIENLESKILIGKDYEKEAIKSWINKKKKIKAKLLYKFHDIVSLINEGKEIKVNVGDNETVKEFHSACDHKEKILMICKSKNQIFGGYTPLCFKSSNVYQNDNKSFLFSLNNIEKYPKNSYTDSISIWCYDNYGPSFHYDLCFLEGKMHIINFCNDIRMNFEKFLGIKKKYYFTRDNWVNKEECYTDSNGVILDSLEIFQIFEENYNFDELKLDNIINIINHIKNNININSVNNFNINSNHMDVNNKIELNFTNNNKKKNQNDVMISSIGGTKNIKKPKNSEKEKVIKKIKEVEFQIFRKNFFENKSMGNFNKLYEEQKKDEIDEKKKNKESLLNAMNDDKFNEDMKENNSNINNIEKDEVSD